MPYILAGVSQPPDIHFSYASSSSNATLTEQHTTFHTVAKCDMTKMNIVMSCEIQ